MIDVKILCLILIAHIWVIYAVPHRFVEPLNEDVSPSFLRGSVEFIPSDDEMKANLKVLPLEKFENVMQFSRSAVESVPKTIVSYYQPLRSAVEHNPLDGDFEVFDTYSKTKTRKEKFLNIVFLSREPKTINTDAFVIPNNPYDNDPHNYRSGSPYQQLVDEKTYNEAQLQKSEQGNTKRGSYKAKEYKVICHTTNWSFYRKGDGKFVPENLDYSLCTHIIYSFATLDAESLQMYEFDEWVDIQQNSYSRTVKLANGKPVYLAIGGWTDSTDNKYSELVSKPENREKFIDNAIPFLKRFGFAGLHFDWDYPVCPQSNCKRGNPSDKMYFTQFIKELQYALQQSDLKLSISISGYKEILMQAYELRALSNLVEFMTVMTFDYHGAWENVTGHVSPLYGSESDKYPQYNTDYAIQYLIKSGVDRDKIIMGIPFYGQSFKLAVKDKGYDTKTDGPGYPGEFTNQPGMLAYHEICNMIRAGAKKGKDPSGNAGPYVTDGMTWVGYDDVEFVTMKTRYCVDNDLGGVSAWTVDLDDFTNSCCYEAFPLLRAVNRAFGRISATLPRGNDCSKPVVTTPPPVLMTSTVDSGAAGIPTQSTAWATHSTTSSWWTQPSPSTTQRPVYQADDKPMSPTPGNVMPASGGECNQIGAYKPHDFNCNLYYVCANGQWNELNCPTGLEWNADHKHCDWPATSGCKAQVVTTTSKRPPSNTNPSKKTTPRTTQMPPITTTQRVTTTRKSTTRKTTTRRPITTQRPDTTQRPTYYETTTMYYTTTIVPQTTYRTTQKRTTQKRTTTPRVTTTVRTTTPRVTTTVRSTSSSTTRKPNKKPVRCENGLYYPHKDCNRYYICTHNKRIAMSCPEGLQYSPETQNCDYEENVKCISKKKYLKLLQQQYKRTGVYNAQLLRAQAGDDCNDGELVPSPVDCGAYLQCLHGSYFSVSCASGLHFDPNSKTCNWPQPGPKACKDVSYEGEFEEEFEEYDSENEENSVNEVSRPSSTTKAPPVKPTVDSNFETLPVYENVEPLSGKYKMICYFTNWAWYRPGIGKYLPDDIDTNLCTHVVYGFAVLNYDELTIRTHDSWADIDNRFYERVVELKNRGVKVTLAIGGWNDSAGDKYSRLVSNPSARAKFVRHVVEFLEKYGFEGLDLDWEYPVCWQVDCKKGRPDEKQNFANFVRELSEAFRPRGLLLSAAVSPSKTVIDAGYDVPTLAKYFDWIAVMTYDFHGQWDKQTGHVAPLYYHPDDEVNFFNSNYSINYWIQLGAPREKIIMGMPLYGQSFTLADAKNNGLNAKAPGPGQAGEFTRAAGFLAYYEICDRILNKGWKVVQDPQGRMGPYAYNGNQWVSFDDQKMLRRKVQYLKSMGIGGGMIWALDLDDFKGRCGQGKHPLLKIIHSELQNEEGSSEEVPEQDFSEEVSETPELAEEIPEVNEEVPEVNEETPEVNEIEPDEESEPVQPEDAESAESDTELDDYDSNEIDEYDNDYKVVCYFTNWAWYRPGIGKYKPEDVDPDLCTHIVYGFAVLDRGTLTIKPHDSWADIDNKFYERVVAYKNKGVKVTVAIGGWNDSAGDKYSRLVLDSSARARFITNVIEFIEKWGFDGLDLDWEYPVCWQVDCAKGNPKEKEAFASFVKELSTAFKPRGLLLSSAVSPSKKVIDAGYNVPVLSTYFDWIAVMCYDYHGQWDKKTGHVAPMYLHDEAWEPTFNVNFTINYWIEKGADPRKLVLGMPTYGQSFSLAERNNNGLNSMTYGGGEAGEETRARGFLSYYEICTRIKRQEWTVVKDSRGRIGPYAYKGDQWVSFDDVSMIRHKSEYVKALGLGGAMIWALDLDDFKNVCDCEEYPLLRTINRVLRQYPGPHNQCFLEKTNIKPTAEATTRKPVITTTRKAVEYTTKVSARPVTTARPTVSRKTSTTTIKPVVYEGEDYDEQDYSEASDEDEVPRGCADGSRIFMNHQTDCNKYYTCNHGMALLNTCPNGLYWNQRIMACDWPLNVKCESTYNDNEIYPSSSQRPQTTKSTQKPKPQATQKPKPTTQKPKPQTQKPKPQKPDRPVVESDPFVPTGNNEFMVVCYFTNWAWYRPGIGKYKPGDIDPTLCTHIVYGFAVLSGDTLTIRTHDSWADIDNNFYTSVSSLKEKGIKVSIALGGWNDSAGDKYGRLLTNPKARAKFIKNVIEFMKKYDFEGLDLDYEYPVCVQVDCNKGKPEEKEGFADFVRELHEAFEPEGFLLSAAVSPSKKVIDAGYDVPTVSEYLDWIAVMTYDFHGQWDKQTGHVAPLYLHPDDVDKTFHANYSINYWIEKGADRKKIVMGMPMYGQSFTLEKSSVNGLNAKAPGPGQAGEFTRSAGFLAFYEICHKVNSGGWTVVRDPEGRMGPYAYNDRQWVSYDDVETIRQKTQYVKDMGLAGAMIWALDLDDFRNRCGCGTHPLLSTINLELGRIQTSRLPNCT